MPEYCTDELGVYEALQLLTKYGVALQGLRNKTNAIPETGNPLLPMDYACRVIKTIYETASCALPSWDGSIDGIVLFEVPSKL
ncbi:hypothetical protein GX50_02672 [[Emmonsia] crescens]|uniref:Uncharacterized protein n=1 Tax=[Emmonsia] crescens TaxID=73230 RepID=A0A2B7ZMU0_9EURO|nr:hypothetical protein GX50_02672 [Emmonsia crescens]